MQRKLLTLTTIAVLSLPASSVFAANDWGKKSQDAWIDGKAEATLLFNGNLNSFDINTDVKHGTVTLTGKVDSDVDSDLAEELILGIDGVKDVDNQLTVIDTSEDTDSITAGLVDSKIATVVTSRILFNSELSALDIDVDVDEGQVTLNGTVESEAAKDLAQQIAENTDDVEGVHNNLRVVDA